VVLQTDHRDGLSAPTSSAGEFQDRRGRGGVKEARAAQDLRLLRGELEDGGVRQCPSQQPFKLASKEVSRRAERRCA